jgi:hypothetical protein
MLARHIPFGPDPPQPTALGSRSLRLAYDLLFFAEHEFVPRIPILWPGLRSASPADQCVAFEVLAFLAGLKKCVIIGWGDGRDTEAGGKVANEWVKEVWDTSRERLRRSPRKPMDEVVRTLLEFMDGCVTHVLGNVQGESAVFAGHVMIYHPPAAAALKPIVNVPSYDPSVDVSEACVQFDESVWAHILDYPTVLPSRGAVETTCTMTLGIVYSRSTSLGTQYSAKHSAEAINASREHWKKYRAVLGPSLPGLELGLSVDGRWEYAEDVDRVKLLSMEAWAMRESGWITEVLGER